MSTALDTQKVVLSETENAAKKAKEDMVKEISKKVKEDHLGSVLCFLTFHRRKRSTILSIA